MLESGASRNYKPRHAEDEEVEKEKKRTDAEEKGGAMKALENRTLDSKREMDILAALDEMKSMKCLDMQLLVWTRPCRAQLQKRRLEEDEALIRSIIQKQKEVTQRISNEDLDDDGNLFQFASESSEGSSNNLKKRKLSEDVSSKPKDVLTKASFSDSTSNGENPTVSETERDAKVPQKSS